MHRQKRVGNATSVAKSEMTAPSYIPELYTIETDFDWGGLDPCTGQLGLEIRFLMSKWTSYLTWCW
jgi:hypothetical protein